MRMCKHWRHSCLFATAACPPTPPYGQNYNWLKPGEKINPRLIMVLHFTQGEPLPGNRDTSAC